MDYAFYKYKYDKYKKLYTDLKKELDGGNAGKGGQGNQGNQGNQGKGGQGKGGMDRLKLFTWNILHSAFVINEKPEYYVNTQNENYDTNTDNDNKRNSRWDMILDNIKNKDPDLIGLQETNFTFYNYLIQSNKFTDYDIIYVGSDKIANSDANPSTELAPECVRIAVDSRDNGIAYYGNISLVKKYLKVNFQKLYFNKIISNHNNAIISKISLQGQEFCWINTHLCYFGYKNSQRMQINQIIIHIHNSLDNQANIIISGDLNESTHNSLEDFNSELNIVGRNNLNAVDFSETACIDNIFTNWDNIFFTMNKGYTNSLQGQNLVPNFRCCLDVHSNYVNCNLINRLSDHQPCYAELNI